MTDVARYFNQHSRRSVEYIEYDGAITALGGTGSVHRTRAGIDRLYVHDAAGSLVYDADLPPTKQGALAALSPATCAIYEEIQRRRLRFEDSVSQAVIAHASVEGDDATVDFERSLRNLLVGLRRKCEAEGWDFEQMSRDSDDIYAR